MRTTHPTAARNATTSALAVVVWMLFGCTEQPAEPDATTLAACEPPYRVARDDVTQHTRSVDASAVPDLATLTSALPLVVLDTHGVRVPDEPRIDATLRLYVPAGDAGASLHDAPALQVAVGVELRGAGSLEFPRKSLGLELRDTAGRDRPLSLLGMPATADWALIAPWVDRSLVRNPLAYALMRELGHWAPRTRMVEVFLNQSGDALHAGDYLGVYVLTERVEAGPGRVDLTDGGFLVELTRRGTVWPDAPWFCSTRTAAYFEITEPSRPDDAQRAWLEDNVLELERRLLEGEPLSEVAQLLDLDVAVDYLLLNEYLDSVDAFWRSTWMTWPRDAPLRLGPLWDMDQTAGVDHVAGWSHTSWPWARQLADHRAFRERLAARWRALRRGALHDDNLRAHVARLTTGLHDAAERDLRRWQAHAAPLEGGYTGEVMRLESWLLRRGAWIDTHLEAWVEHGP